MYKLYCGPWPTCDGVTAPPALAHGSDLCFSDVRCAPIRPDSRREILVIPNSKGAHTELPTYVQHDVEVVAGVEQAGHSQEEEGAWTKCLFSLSLWLASYLEAEAMYRAVFQPQP